ncbi:MAG: hypothetical protein ABI134_18175 [Byssovorax sp.]
MSHRPAHKLTRATKRWNSCAVIKRSSTVRGSGGSGGLEGVAVFIAAIRSVGAFVLKESARGRTKTAMLPPSI